jgi:hypothetical protein
MLPLVSEIKVFCFFSSEKKEFLSSPWFVAFPASPKSDAGYGLE